LSGGVFDFEPPCIFIRCAYAYTDELNDNSLSVELIVLIAVLVALLLVVCVVVVVVCARKRRRTRELGETIIF